MINLNDIKITPRDQQVLRLLVQGCSNKEVATLVWQGLTNRDIAGVLGTSEQVVKNYLRTAFDKLGVWTRLELALYVASHGGASWHLELGLAPLPPRSDWKPDHEEARP